MSSAANDARPYGSASKIDIPEVVQTLYVDGQGRLVIRDGDIYNLRITYSHVSNACHFSQTTEPPEGLRSIAMLLAANAMLDQFNADEIDD